MLIVKRILLICRVRSEGVSRGTSRQWESFGGKREAHGLGLVRAATPEMPMRRQGRFPIYYTYRPRYNSQRHVPSEGQPAKSKQLFQKYPNQLYCHESRANTPQGRPVLPFNNFRQLSLNQRIVKSKNRMK